MARAARRGQQEGPRPRRGPAPDPNALRRGRIVTFRSSLTLLQRIDARARAAGVSRARWVLDRVAEACGTTAPKGGEGTTAPTPRQSKAPAAAAQQAGA